MITIIPKLSHRVSVKINAMENIQEKGIDQRLQENMVKFLEEKEKKVAAKLENKNLEIYINSKMEEIDKIINSEFNLDIKIGNILVDRSNRSFSDLLSKGIVGPQVISFMDLRLENVYKIILENVNALLWPDTIEKFVNFVYRGRILKNNENYIKALLEGLKNELDPLKKKTEMKQNLSTHFSKEKKTIPDIFLRYTEKSDSIQLTIEENQLRLKNDIIDNKLYRKRRKLLTELTSLEDENRQQILHQQLQSQEQIRIQSQLNEKKKTVPNLKKVILRNQQELQDNQQKLLQEQLLFYQKEQEQLQQSEQQKEIQQDQPKTSSTFFKSNVLGIVPLPNMNHEKN